MRRIMILALSSGALALSGAAHAQACAGPLQQSAERSSHLPGETPYQVHDQLVVLHEQASEIMDSDPARCLGMVAEMNALIARHLPGGAGGAAGGAAGGSSPGGSVPLPSGPSAEEALADAQADDGERLAGRIARATHDEAGDLRAVGEYRDAARSYLGAMRAFATARRYDSAELGEIEAEVRAIDEITRELERTVTINAPDDVMHARLEDAVRRVEEARRALERAWKRYYDRKAADDDFLAPLVPAGTAPDDDFLAPLGDADTRAAQIRLRKAERALKQVRNGWDPHLHRRDRPFLDMRDGYKTAFKAEYDGFEEELKAFDATIDSYLPDRIGEYTRRRAELWKQHEARLEAVFDRHAIP